MNRIATLGFWIALTGSGSVWAQIEDPRDRIREIAKRVADDLAEIDKLLLQRSTSKAAATSQEANKKLEALLKESTSGQGDVIQGIDALIEQINKMTKPGNSPGEGSGQQGKEQGQEQGQQPEQQGQQGENQQQNQTPDFLQQGQQPDQQGKQQGSQPRGGQQNPDGGQNRPGGQAPDSGTERVGHGQDAVPWGTLPPYLQQLQGRGSLPEVPEKYRRFVEAFLKQSATKSR